MLPLVEFEAFEFKKQSNENTSEVLEDTVCYTERVVYT